MMAKHSVSARAPPGLTGLLHAKHRRRLIGLGSGQGIDRYPSEEL